jgi:hypothetical protein
LNDGGSRAVDELATTLIARIEEAEQLSARSFSGSARGSVQRSARLRKATSEAASLAMAIGILVNGETGA